MFEIFRSVTPFGGHHKGTSSCRAKKCKRSTREGKPFCSEHIECAPYVQRILRIREEAAEEERVLNLQRGRISKQGFYYRETLLLLRSKDFTAKGLARRLDITHYAASRLIVMMTLDGLVKRDATSRGDMTIGGLGQCDLAGDRD